MDTTGRKKRKTLKGGSSTSKMRGGGGGGGKNETYFVSSAHNQKTVHLMKSKTNYTYCINPLFHEKANKRERGVSRIVFLIN